MKDANRKWIVAGAVGSLALAVGMVYAQPPGGSGRGGRGAGGFGRGGRGPASAIFTAVDADKDGSITRAELKTAFDSWFTAADTKKSGAVTEDQLLKALEVPMPTQAIVNAFDTWGNSIPFTAAQNEVDGMMAALPTDPGAKPAKARGRAAKSSDACRTAASTRASARTAGCASAPAGAWR